MWLNQVGNVMYCNVIQAHKTNDYDASGKETFFSFLPSASNSNSVKSSLKAVPWFEEGVQLNVLFVVSNCACIALIRPSQVSCLGSSVGRASAS